jgi:STE24 endopeptidase
MVAHRHRVPLAVVVTAIAAGGATLLLRPRARAITPAAVSAGDYFTPEQLERAHAFRVPQRRIALASLALDGAALALLVAKPPPVLERLGRRPLLGAAAAGAGLTVATTAIGLPLGAVSEQRARNVGLSTQTWRSWAGDAAKATAIGAVISGAGAAIGTGVIRRFPRHWWLPGAGAVVALSTLMAFAAPVVIDPLFNKFEPLPEGPLRDEVLELAGRANVNVGQVYRIDASRRTTAHNAYVWGLGRTKRVVMFDTLIRDLPDDQVRSVVAHELSHVVSKDILRSLLWLALVAPAGTWLVKALAERLNRGEELGVPAALPPLALAGAIVSGVLGPAGKLLSRRVEVRADAFALDLTGEPAAFVELTRNLAVTNLADPATPRIFQLLFGTHPTTLQRIGAGLAWEARR